MHPDATPAARAGIRQHTALFARQSALCFILFSLILVWTHGRWQPPDDLWHIRSGLLRDVTSEMPLGRQAMVSSLAVMPLPSLATLPFLPFLNPEAYGYALLYGAALLLALAAPSLSHLLNRATRSRAGEASPLLLSLAALAAGATGRSDLLVPLAMLIIALDCETRSAPEVRALAGVFWALLLLSHLVGMVAALLRLAWMALERIRKVAPERRAVNFIQGTTIIYSFCVYLFLNGMIMGSPLYPFTSAPWWRVPLKGTAERKQELARLLTTRYSDCRPVVSGVWGFAIQPLLEATEGFHVADYHASKLPPGDLGSLVLVVPAGDNPLARFSDWQPDPATTALPLCEQLPGWIFVRLEL